MAWRGVGRRGVFFLCRVDVCMHALCRRLETGNVYHMMFYTLLSFDLSRI